MPHSIKAIEIQMECAQVGEILFVFILRTGVFGKTFDFLQRRIKCFLILVDWPYKGMDRKSTVRQAITKNGRAATNVGPVKHFHVTQKL